jgi:hypothetical protein
MEAGLEIRARARENDKIKRATAVEEQSFKHGLTGYRAYGCRCEVCKVAGRIHNEDLRATGRNRRAYKAGDYVRPQEAVEEPAVDWSEVAHLRPGHGVRRRKRNDDEAA